MTPVLARLAWRFLVMAFLAIGGANAVIPEMHRQVVEAERWMTDGEFASLFAIASAAPGPNVLIVTLIGWHVAGILGALAATACMVAPPACLTFAVFHVWNRYRHAAWQAPVKQGLAAVTVGLVSASAFLLSRAADTGYATAAITVATALLTWRTKVNPLWAFAGAASVGAAGFI